MVVVIISSVGSESTRDGIGGSSSASGSSDS